MLSKMHVLHHTRSEKVLSENILKKLVCDAEYYVEEDDGDFHYFSLNSSPEA
jgi:hypothetical protein